jgi:hypothetical protein
MGLTEIAEGLEITTRQHERTIHPVDDTVTDLSARLQTHAESLPCSPETARDVLQVYAQEMAVPPAAEAADVSSVTVTKLLHRCGVDGLSPLSEKDNEVLADWLNGVESRSAILDDETIDERGFALATYLQTHAAIPELEAAFRGYLDPRHQTRDRCRSGSSGL